MATFGWDISVLCMGKVFIVKAPNRSLSLPVHMEPNSWVNKQNLCKSLSNPHLHFLLVQVSKQLQKPWLGKCCSQTLKPRASDSPRSQPVTWKTRDEHKTLTWLIRWSSQSAHQCGLGEAFDCDWKAKYQFDPHITVCDGGSSPWLISFWES